MSGLFLYAATMPMVISAAKTVMAYLAELPAERREVVSTVRDLVNRHLPTGYVEGVHFGMIGWVIPLARYPVTYNKLPLMYLGLAAQKNNYALYLTNTCSNNEVKHSLHAAYARAGKKLDMGGSCLRFKSLDGFLGEAIGQIIAATSVDQCIARHEASRR